MSKSKTGASTRTRRSTADLSQRKAEKLIKSAKAPPRILVKSPEPKTVKKVEPVKVFLGYFAKYRGKHKHMSLSPGIGKVVPGVWYKVDENIFNALKQVDHWLAVKRYKDVDATKLKGGGK